MIRTMEELEDRRVPAATAVLVGNQLVVTAFGGGAHTVSFDPVAGGVRVAADGSASTFAAQGLIYVGDPSGVNVVQNNTNVPGVLLGGSLDDRIFGGTGLNYIDPGPGTDLVYALPGTNVIRSGDGDFDRVFTNAAAQVVADDADLVVRFFAAGRTPGSGSFGLVDGVLYVTPPDGGSRVALAEPRPGVVLAVYDFGATFQVFAGVRAVAYFGGSGDDVYVNDTTLTEAAYGSAGHDTLVSARGEFSVLKGSGGDDRLLGRAKQNDLSGNGGSDFLIVLTAGMFDVFRTDDADLVAGAGAGDLFISP